MNRNRTLPLPLITLILSLGSFALGQGIQNNPGKFKHERAIIPGGPGPNRLRLDAGLLTGGNPQWQFTYAKEGIEGKQQTIATGGLGDLRIYDSSNREVPYLLIEPKAPAPVWLDGRIAPIGFTRKASGFQADLGRLLLMDRVRVTGIPAPFIKRGILEASSDAMHWTRLQDEATIFDLPEERLRQLEIEFLQGEYRYLKFTWDDSASPRIPLPRSVSAQLVSAGSMPPPLQLSIPFEKRISEPGMSRYRLILPSPRLPISEIIVSTANGNVLRRAKITESRFSGSEIVPINLGSAVLRKEMRGDLSAAEMSIPITPPQQAALELAIEDGNNPPLQITEITASFAHLPWIYFENANERTLTARYGNPNLKAPAYDLEAARSSAMKAQTMEARWGAPYETKVVAESPGDMRVPNAGAAIDLGGFRYARKIAAGKAGLNILPLDAEVLAHSSIEDLRIAGADGRQIPYILEKAEEPLILDLPALEKISAPSSNAFSKNNETDTRSYYRLRFPFSNLPSSRLVLATSLTVFQRHLSIRIEKNPFNDRQHPWTESIAGSDWACALQDKPAPALTLMIPSLKTAEMMLVIEEGDNSPLPITSVKLLLPSYRLRFFRESQSDLNLYYGNSSLDAPRYDLAILAPYLTGSSAEEIHLGPGITVAPVKSQATASKLFWGILIAAVLALLILIVRLSKKA